MTLGDRSDSNSVISGVVVLLTRGVLLWVVVPAAVFAWLIIGHRYRRQGVTIGQYLGWIDVNLIVGLQRTLFRPLVRNPAAWVPAASMTTVAHRIGAIDPA